MGSQNIFTCYDFDCDAYDSLAECAQLVENTDTGVSGYILNYKERPCSKSDLIASFDDAAAALRFSIEDVKQTALDMQPVLEQKLRKLIYDKMVDPFLAQISEERTDCSFLRESYLRALDGACYNFGGALSQYTNIFNLCSHFGFVL